MPDIVVIIATEILRGSPIGIHWVPGILRRTINALHIRAKWFREQFENNVLTTAGIIIWSHERGRVIDCLKQCPNIGMIMIISPIAAAADHQETFGDQGTHCLRRTPAWNPPNDLSTKHRNHCRRKSDQRGTSVGESTNENARIMSGRRGRRMGVGLRGWYNLIRFTINIFHEACQGCPWAGASANDQA